MTELVLTYVVNAAIQATLVAATTLVLLRLLRGAPARIRFAIAAIAFAIAAIGPAVTPLFVRTGAAPATGVIRAAARPGIAVAIALGFAVGAAVAVLRLGASAMRARTLLRSSQPFDGDVRLSDRIAAPVTIGSRILIPRRLAGDELLPAALAHERAHVRRRDFLVNALLEIAAVPLWFHPAAHLLRRELATLREMACDEEAAAQSGARVYAAALVHLAAFAARRHAVALSIAGASIERRVNALRQPRHSAPAANVARVAATILPFALLLACTRVAVPPAAVQATLCGIWHIVPGASDFHGMRPTHYDEYTQWIAQGARTLHVRQRRVSGGRAEEHAWSVTTDGQWHPVGGVPGVTGRATWRDGRLSLEMTGPGAHRERAVAVVRGDRMICDGATERSHFHAVFEREQ